GAGVSDIPVGGMQLGLGVFTVAKFDGGVPGDGKAQRVNAHLCDIRTNTSGTLRVLLPAVGGTKQDARGPGSGISSLHTQKDFLLPGISNSVYLQASRGHARIDGEFEAIDGTRPGRRSTRIADSINWQSGPFGGQALIGYQTNKEDLTGVETKDFSIG